MVFLLFSFLAAVIPGSQDYLAGHQAEEQGRYADAFRAYEACAAQEGPLRAYARTRQALCRASSGDAKGAAEELERVLKEFPEGPWVRMVEAELGGLYARLGDATRAASCSERVLACDFRPWWYDQYAWTAADRLLVQPTTAAKAHAFFRSLLEDPRYRGRRYDAAERLSTSYKSEDLWLAAESLVRFGSVKSAKPIVAALAPLATSSSESMARWRYLQGRILLGDGAAAEGRTLLEQVAAEQPETPYARLALLQLAKSYGPAQDAESQRYIERLVAQHAGSVEAGDALWWQAGQYLDKGEFASAVAVYERLVSVAPQHDRADDALLAAGNTLRAQNQARKALTTFRDLVKGYPTSALRPEAAYWGGRLCEVTVDKAGAVECYRAALEGGFGDYYGARALSRLQELDRDNPKLREVIRVPGTSLTLGLFAMPAAPVGEPSELSCGIDQLARLRFFGLHGMREGEWEAFYLAGRRETGPASPALYAAMADAGLAHTAWDIINGLGWGLENGQPTPARLRVLYPRAYWDEVERMAREARLDPYLLLAVARQESTFRASVSSSAGAQGVMQLMPATARWLAEKEPAVSPEHASNLDDPSSSLRLGAHYLARMLAQFDGNLAHALAAYNGGPGNVRKWLRAQPGLEPERFIETIPFGETRTYVKRVLGNYAAYRSLYPNESARPTRH